MNELRRYDSLEISIERDECARSLLSDTYAVTRFGVREIEEPLDIPALKGLLELQGELEKRFIRALRKGQLTDRGQREFWSTILGRELVNQVWNRVLSAVSPKRSRPRRVRATADATQQAAGNAG